MSEKAMRISTAALLKSKLRCFQTLLELLKQQARSFLAEDNSLISAGDRRSVDNLWEQRAHFC